MVKFSNISKSFDNGKNNALNNVSFTLQKGKSYVIVGESGSGKTTLIRLLCGLEIPSTGTIMVNGNIVSSDTVFIQPEERKIGLVFQDYALFPHLSVYENVVYGISSDTNKKNRVKEVLKLVGLSGFGQRYPHELSGGQQQRVALARALAPKPNLLILDEPFSNLDASLRTQLRNELFSIIKKTDTTAIFVTHDTEDALAVADEILVLHNGFLVQQNNSEVLYNYPENIYVASLFGTILSFDKNILRHFGIENEATIHIREEFFLINKRSDFTCSATILSNKFMGSYYIVDLRIANQHYFIPSNELIEIGECIVGFNSNAII